VFAILDALVENRDGATLSELAAFTGAPKTSLVGLLAAMVEEGCLRRNESGRYLVGSRVHTLAMRALAGRELPELARPFLVDLVEGTGETAVLGVLADDADRVVYVARVESADPIRYAVSVGERRELHCTALGKVLLAHLEPNRLERFLKANPLRRFTPATITRAAALKSELRRIRETGIARTYGERVSAANGLAAPIFDREGHVVAGLLIAGPAERMRTNERRNARLLVNTAQALTRFLGGSNGKEKP
jgi:DNA-binding IclR family transcriptional regulator